jgi:hypothetical protein
VIPRSNDDVAEFRLSGVPTTKPVEVVMADVVIPTVATETAELDTVAIWRGVAETSPYALSVSVRVAQPVPPLLVADPIARLSRSEKPIVESINTGLAPFTKLTFGVNVIELSHAAVT